METSKLRRFAQFARRSLIEQIGAKLALVRANGSSARREVPKAVAELELEISETSVDDVIEKVSYTWFNRFCALRYMDANRVNRISVVSPVEGQFQPEILAEAKMGHMDDEVVTAAVQPKVRALLDGTASSPDSQQEAYRMLVVAACNFWHRAMPFLFEAISDYTELLMPDDLLSGNSILTYTREAMTPDACQDVEVIGWLYQFYISEKKDDVFEGLKKNKKIATGDIPAATQLFTPHYVVRYLVENSLGRLWMLNRPSSRLAEKMEFYMPPLEDDPPFVRLARPEDIKLCDPACGSGHMLTYAFDLLYAIYEEEGIDPVEIPEKILTNNLFGMEIDERAAELAAFALIMKARAKQRRFLNKRVQPNICHVRPVKFLPHELEAYVREVGRDLFTADLRQLLTQFEEADNFGSLIRPVDMDFSEVRRVLAEKGIGNQLLLEHVHHDVLRVLEQAEFLSRRYGIVVANPPYLSSGGMNGRLLAWAKEFYPDSKSDLFAMFIVRNLELAVARGFVGMITMQSWMFLASYEALRRALLAEKSIASMAHLGTRAFDSIGGEVVSTTAFVLNNASGRDWPGDFLRLTEGTSELQKGHLLQDAIRHTDCKWRFRSTSAEFQKIPGAPIAYWISARTRDVFDRATSVGDLGKTRRGLQTGDSSRFTRKWYEVSPSSIGRDMTGKDAAKSGAKWFLFNSGGTYRKWSGNIEDVVNWANDGLEIKATGKAIIPSEDLYFRKGITWPKVSGGKCSFRYFCDGIVPGDAGPCFYSDDENLFWMLLFGNSQVARSFLQFLSPTLNFEVGVMARMPVLPTKGYDLGVNARALIGIAEADWNTSETSPDFKVLPLLPATRAASSLEAAYANQRCQWSASLEAMRALEEENNRHFIAAYGLQDELTSDVPLSDITLISNPHYRYGSERTEQDRESMLRADAMRELISYAVGCMFGRYSLDKPGLLLTDQTEPIRGKSIEASKTLFSPDEDNVIPLVGGDWFSDELDSRFREFLRFAFGNEFYEENLRFLEMALGKGDKKLLLGDYFLKEFYADHVKRYKRRPIYWLFSSPKGSFNVLIYLHRYRPDTASVVLRYLRDFRGKLSAGRSYVEKVIISDTTTQSERTKAAKEIESLKKQILELDDYERDTLFPLAAQQINLDLDDGVKVNYGKLGAALKKIPGLDANEED